MNLETFAKQKFVIISINVGMGLLFSTFILANMRGFVATDKLSLLFIAFDSTIICILFFIRNKPTRVSGDPLDWATAIGTSYISQAFRPTATMTFWPADILMLIGIILQGFSYLSLNRSFGVVPAQRSLKTGGAYAIVRHPIYASYSLVAIGYVISNPSIRNIVIVATMAILIAARITQEERLLKEDPDYRSYTERVRFKLYPGLY